MIDGIEACDIGEQHLSSADIAGRFFAADMLFTCLQCQAVSGLAVVVDRNADDAAGQLALVLVFRRHEGGMRAAVAKRHAEALRRADRNVRADFARWLEQREREQVGRDTTTIMPLPCAFAVNAA